MKKSIIAMAITLGMSMPMVAPEAADSLSDPIAASFSRAFSTGVPAYRDALEEAIDQIFWRSKPIATATYAQPDAVMVSFQRAFADRHSSSQMVANPMAGTDLLSESIQFAFWRQKG